MGPARDEAGSGRFVIHDQEHFVVGTDSVDGEEAEVSDTVSVMERSRVLEKARGNRVM